ncbi:hypothetical protein Pmar_PMAR001241 [Perkinsus marinus ATCC 50983]|uniref:RRM domain-containing protein n=1 Tax=Perkinsus marinus (strain ATCC 50983 / TXsc) TaxID=423536 RepID=C5KT93_PERM5|nr:hypothetical protein Pmar_PMAR001241 [Perkinsus marinus ATCC 50983]EER12443.1 hypothetical protein Pmar_PMAR001241 [Perkinsus marinus ATCC 50983]|eukprot:XP_002780648.1 hypothetical protein Pmar_PMAR001241 [Perkinsus marinus ATCC 50983]
MSSSPAVRQEAAREDSLLHSSTGSQTPVQDAAPTDCLRVLFPATQGGEQQQQALQLGQIFEVLNKIGDVRWVDFSNFHLDHTVVVAYFDLRAAQRAFTSLNEAGLSTSAEYVSTPDCEKIRKVVLSVSGTDSFDTIREELTHFGDLRRMSFQDCSLVAEFFDSRACASINATLGASGLELGRAMGLAPRARPRSLSGSSKDHIGSTHPPGGSCSGAQRAAMMGYQQPRVVSSVGQGVAIANRTFPDKTTCASETMSSSRYPKTPAVPNSQFVIDLDRVVSGADPRTTCMIRNIPNKYTQKMLLRLFDSVPNICGQYDFFYLPMDFRNKCNVGYAFIDFANPRISIPALVRAFDGKKWERFNSEKICKITFARLQGSKQLMEHFRASSVMQQSNKQIRPWFQRDRSIGQYPRMVNSSIMEHSSHQQASGALSSSSAMSAGGEADAAVNYDRALADLCAIGEPSLLATALAQLQRNEEDPSSVILDNFPLEGWSDAASSIGGFSAPAAYYSGGSPGTSTPLPTLGGYSQLHFTPPLGWTSKPDGTERSDKK